MWQPSASGQHLREPEREQSEGKLDSKQEPTYEGLGVQLSGKVHAWQGGQGLTPGGAKGGGSNLDGKEYHKLTFICYFHSAKEEPYWWLSTTERKMITGHEKLESMHTSHANHSGMFCQELQIKQQLTTKTKTLFQFLS